MDYGTRRGRAAACRGTCEHGEVTARIERVKACLNGGRRRDEHPAVPVTAAQLAASASAAVAAGAEAIHLHPRDEGGAESLRQLRAAGVTAPVLLHGEVESCWPLVRQAGQLGLATRIGLEDVITGPEGEPVTGNADLTRRALAVWTAASAEERWQ
jgi:uncharacterized protein (DUF849 family)